MLKPVLYSAAISGVLSAALAGWLAYGVASGNCAKRELAVAKADTAQLVTAIEDANRATAAELPVSVAQSAQRARKDTAAQEIVHEAAADPDRGCEWSADQRLRISDLYTLYGYHENGAPLAMRGALPTPSPYELAPPSVGD